MVESTIVSCPVCSYPVSLSFEGETATCAYCGEKLEAIARGVTIPTPLFVGLLAFGAGILFGPAIIASTSGGSKWLEEQARAGLRR